MQFQTLPDDVLFLILDCLIPLNMIYWEWKDQLFLLSVCQRLRRLALPLLYRYSFACIGFDPQPEDVLTNVSLLFTANEPASMMDITFRDCPPESMSTIIDVLNKHMRVCATVTSLKINTIAYDFPSQPVNQNKHKMELLTKLFPAVNDLTLGGNTDVYDKALIQHYASRLRSLRYSRNDSIPEQVQFEQIRDLEVVVYPSKRHLLPHINIHTIQQLTIFMLHPDCTWRLFGATGPGTVEVPNLVELKLGYIGKQVNYDFVVSMKDRCKLMFPRLKSLRLSGTADYFPLVNSAVLPQKMDRIEISAAPATFLTFANVVLPQAKWLKCKLATSNNVEGPAFFSSLNNLIQNSQHSRGVDLYLSSGIGSFNARSLTCPSLIRLQISIPLDAYVVVEIVKRFSRLVWLSLLAASDMSQVLGTDSDGKTPTVPLNTNLEDLSLEYSPDHSTQLQTLKYLLLRLPALKKVGSWGVNTDDLKKFAEENVAKYPHLANIKFI